MHEEAFLYFSSLELIQGPELEARRQRGEGDTHGRQGRQRGRGDDRHCRQRGGDRGRGGGWAAYRERVAAGAPGTTQPTV